MKHSCMSAQTLVDTEAFVETCGLEIPRPEASVLEDLLRRQRKEKQKR